MNSSGAKWLHRYRNRVARELTPRGRHDYCLALKMVRKGLWTIPQAVDFLSRHRVGAYVEL